ncbi:alkaline phosphatase [Blumeria hordei DH14]|uniref:Alkaline phosphatase n=1 Tax=Blumeria graminis f. sp. hordei (strain DH14) TaxID=546991 RepID=N1JBA3_BLUG1|nr:alkaline phosphatase [Blumeria hordei DH14]
MKSEYGSVCEKSTLLGVQRKKTGIKDRYGWMELSLFTWAVVATLTAGFLAFVSKNHESLQGDQGKKIVTGKRNLVFMVSDGMGPASLSMARSFRQYEAGLPNEDILNLDRYLIGSSRTKSSSSLVTDSAAGATAFSCGKKSYNGAISMLPDFAPCGTVLEAAKRAGYMTGLVVTTDITDATPACFASHVKNRRYGDDIALQEVGENPLGRVVDLMFGGGLCHFLPNTTQGSCRRDDRDVIKIAKNDFGWNYISSRKEFDALRPGKSMNVPLLGLFAESDIPYELDRRNLNDVYPSLDEMTRMALKVLEMATKNSDKGFFLMIEGSRIDHAGHGNDPSAQVREVLAYDEAFSSVVRFIEESETEGVLVSTSDHETGGLSVARQTTSQYPVYKWYPEALANSSKSAEYLAAELKRFMAKDQNGNSIENFISEELVRKGLGIVDASRAEIQMLIDEPSQSIYTFADMVSRRAQIGWSTHGHSAVDVNVYGTIGSESLRGNHENTEVGEFLQKYLDVDVDAITKELRDNFNASKRTETLSTSLSEKTV